MWTSSQGQKDIRITHLNHWPKNLINKYIRYKRNVLSTFSWLEPVLTPSLDIGIAKSGSDLVHSPPSRILTTGVKARKSFHGVFPCLVMMYHQTNLDCKSFSISEDIVETIVALTLDIAKWYFWMIFWLMAHHHTKFDRSEILSGQTFTEAQNLNLFTRHSSLWTCTVKLSWSPQKISSSEHIREIVIFDCVNQNSVTLTLTLKIETNFSHTMLWLIMLSHHTGFGYKWFSDALNIIQTNINWNF